MFSRVAGIGLLACVARTAFADDEPPPDPPPVEIHGFVSQGYLKTTDNNFLAETSGAGSFEFTEVGVNLSRSLGEHLRVGLQLFARDLGPIGDYSAKIDWAFLDYRWRDWLGFRAGRIKLPFGLYNDTSDIDAAHPVALLPQSVYPAQNRDFLLAQTGVEVYGYRDFHDSGALDYRLYAGTIFIDVQPQDPRSPFTLLRLAIPYVIGGRLVWETPLQGLRVGASVQRLRLETDFLDGRDPTMPAPLSADIPATLTVGSIEYVGTSLLAAAEYSRWYTSVESSDPTLSQPRTAQVRGYWMAAYRLRSWMMPGAYYSAFYPRAGEHAGKGAKQHDVAATVRFDLNPNWLFKLEAHALRGTADVDLSLNPDVTSREQLANRWWLFVAKTTVYF